MSPNFHWQIPGLVNVDFADVRTVMLNAGTSLMGQGRASGKGRAKAAAAQVTLLTTESYVSII